MAIAWAPAIEATSLHQQSRLPEAASDPGLAIDAPLEALRTYSSPGDTVLRATLIHYPRSGRPVEWRAVIWIRWKEGRPIYRIVAQPEAEAAGGSSGIAYLIDSTRKSLWRWRQGDEAVERLADGSWNQPMFPGLHLSAFDLVGGFLFLNPVVDLGSARLKGRPARLYEFPAPADGFDEEVAYYRVGLDERFHAPLLAEALGPDGDVLRSLEVLNLRQIGEDWMIRATDFHDHRQRERVRLRVDAAALRVTSDWEWTDPEALSDPTQFPRDQMQFLR